MEPTRYTAYNMGNDGYWSWMWSIIFVLAGSLAITINHIVRYIIRVKKNEPLIATVNKPFTFTIAGAVSAIGLGLTILGSIFMLTSEQSNFLGFNRFNNGFILLTVGLSFLLILVCIAIYLVQGFKKSEVTNA
jgi:hypothetical protein